MPILLQGVVPSFNAACVASPVTSPALSVREARGPSRFLRNDHDTCWQLRRQTSQAEPGLEAALDFDADHARRLERAVDVAVAAERQVLEAEPAHAPRVSQVVR